MYIHNQGKITTIGNQEVQLPILLKYVNTDSAKHGCRLFVGDSGCPRISATDICNRTQDREFCLQQISLLEWRVRRRLCLLRQRILFCQNNVNKKVLGQTFVNSKREKYGGTDILKDLNRDDRPSDSLSAELRCNGSLNKFLTISSSAFEFILLILDINQHKRNHLQKSYSTTEKTCSNFETFGKQRLYT